MIQPKAAAAAALDSKKLKSFIMTHSYKLRL